MAIAAEAAALNHQRIIWGAPVFDQVRIGWLELRHAAVGYATFNQSLMTADFPGGGSIAFRSLDEPDNARGHTADGVVIDEAGDVKETAWYEVLRPMLIDTGGWAWGIGSPRGHNWFWREFMAAGDRDDVASWQAPTLGVKLTDSGLVREPHPLENPDISFSEIQQLWETMPERSFQQEVLSEFIDTGGGVFRGVQRAAIHKPAAAEPGHVYVMGVDWGKYNDFTVFSVLDATAKRQVALERTNKIDYQFQVDRLVTLFRAYRPSAIVAEANSIGDPIIEQLKRRNLPVHGFNTNNASKKEAIEGLSLALERDVLGLLDDPIQKSELLAYDSERLPSGLLRYGAPEGMHDDTVIALALAWYAIAHQAPGKIRPTYRY